MNEEQFVDIRFKKLENNYIISYRTEMTVYEESLYGGSYVSIGWNGAGYISNASPLPNPNYLKYEKIAEPQAFELEMDGQSLGSHWEWEGFDKVQEGSALHAIVKLKHALRPVAINIHTLLDGTPILNRWLEITNTSDKPSALSSVKTWSGGLQSTPRWKHHLHENAPLYSIGYMEGDEALDEGHFMWHSLPSATYVISGRYLRNRHRHPMFVLRNNATGEHFIGQFAYSGGYAFSFDLRSGAGTLDMHQHDAQAHLSFKIGPDGPAPLRMIATLETISTPEVHLGMLFGDLDQSIQAMHEHIRRSVFTIPLAQGRGCWVEAVLGIDVEMSEAEIFDSIDNAADLGAEVFFMDAGWYTPATGESEWYTRVGDWNADRYAHGIKPFRDRTLEKGMLFGLWMEPERLGNLSETFKQHPEWLAKGYEAHEPNSLGGGLIDLGKPEAAAWVEQQIVKLIEENELDFFRLDYNINNIKAGGQTFREGYIENSYWRYYENFNSIFANLRKRFPNVIFENCASGGGRTDLSTVRLFSHTWITDWQVAPRSFRITNGMTMALPPESVDRLIACQGGHITADMNFQARQLLFVRPTIGSFTPRGSERNPVQLKYVRHMIDLYKKFVRPFISTSKLYHHTPEFRDFEPKGWGVLELASSDRSKGIAGIFQLSDPQQSELTLRLRGLDISKRYKVTFDNNGQSCEIEGFVLMNQGLIIRLEGALTSELLLFESVD